MNKSTCLHLAAFMKTQKDVIQKHLDEHKFLRQIQTSEEALESFIHDYGWLIRELYCTRICEYRNQRKGSEAVYLSDESAKQ